MLKNNVTHLYPSDEEFMLHKFQYTRKVDLPARKLFLKLCLVSTKLSIDTRLTLVYKKLDFCQKTTTVVYITNMYIYLNF